MKHQLTWWGEEKHGSLYKIILAVKRIIDWEISEEFEERMNKISQVKHQNILQTVGFYCSDQEKLLIYEYQQNGSLSQLLHGKYSTYNSIFNPEFMESFDMCKFFSSNTWWVN